MRRASSVTAFLGQVRRRIIAIGVAAGCATGLILGATSILVLRTRLDSPALATLAVITAAIGGVVGGLVASRRKVAHEVERRAPESRNAIFTAAELLESDQSRHSATIIELVEAQASEAIARLEPAKLFPALRASLAVVIGLAAWGLVVAMRNPAVRGALPRAVSAGLEAPGSFEVLVTPPAYAGRKTQRLTTPTRLDVFAGSRIRITTDVAGARAYTVDGELSPASGTPNTFETIATADGFIAVQMPGAARRLVGLTVTPDLPPRVKVTAPGKDLFIGDTKRRIPVEIEVRDDIGVASLKLRYTKVSGSGERFTFIDGEIPITIARASAVDWTAKGTIDLGALNLVEGDMLVYRGAATDGRPNAPVAESDAFIVEITSPLSVAAEGFSQDDQMDKYALSQQMVILKTERLLARAATMAPESLAYHSQLIGAEQRSVRAEFVFMMGGEVAEEVIAAAGGDINEEAEAANESELAAGRMVNRGRVALVEAIRRMSRASTKLNEVSPAGALPDEKAALAALQEAFSRTRYLLRALTQRERLDLSRRLTGVLSLAARDTRPAALAADDPQVTSLRRALASLATLAGTDSAGSKDIGVTADLAQQVLLVDPSDSTLQRVAARVQDAGKALRGGNATEARRHFDDAATLLTAALRARLPRESVATQSSDLRRVRGALSEARRRGAPR